jgi:exopolyphosphatase/guanosine-5'-triphosphate,3'-diphosphate pyrophosphatase
VIIDAALERTVTRHRRHGRRGEAHGVRAIAAVGTAGLRIAANGKEVVAAMPRAPAFISK